MSLVMFVSGVEVIFGSFGMEPMLDVESSEVDEIVLFLSISLRT
jgi:hypothetical protein